jgi:glycosyltransferase involved in cell wall biosynthesis
MTTPLLSLVVPVYNVAPYLPRCLESLAALTPPADEIIVVDDGSTDDCPHILAEFASRLPQMRVIRQENGGASIARNTGLDAARGTYLAFVDADDFVEPDAYAEALRQAENERLDMVLFNARYHFEGRKPDHPVIDDTVPTKVITGCDWIRRRLTQDRLLHMVWPHLYRRDFIEANQFRFVPRLLSEDVIWTTHVLLKAQRICYLPQIAYNYRISIRHAPPEVRQKRLEALIDSSVINAQVQADFARTVSDIELHSLLGHHLVDGALSIFHLVAKLPDQSVARARLIRLRTEGVLALLWQHAGDFAQRRRIAKAWLKSWIL